MADNARIVRIRNGEPGVTNTTVRPLHCLACHWAGPTTIRGVESICETHCPECNATQMVTPERWLDLCDEAAAKARVPSASEIRRGKQPITIESLLQDAIREARETGRSLHDVIYGIHLSEAERPRPLPADRTEEAAAKAREEKRKSEAQSREQRYNDWKTIHAQREWISKLEAENAQLREVVQSLIRDPKQLADAIAQSDKQHKPGLPELYKGHIPLVQTPEFQSEWLQHTHAVYASADSVRDVSRQLRDRWTWETDELPALSGTPHVGPNPFRELYDAAVANSRNPDIPEADRIRGTRSNAVMVDNVDAFAATPGFPAMDAINDYTRARMREDGFFQRILPPVTPEVPGPEAIAIPNPSNGPIPDRAIHGPTYSVGRTVGSLGRLLSAEF